MTLLDEGKGAGASNPAGDNTLKNVLVLITNQKGFSGGKKDYGN